MYVQFQTVVLHKHTNLYRLLLLSSLHLHLLLLELSVQPNNTRVLIQGLCNRRVLDPNRSSMNEFEFPRPLQRDNNKKRENARTIMFSYFTPQTPFHND